MKTHLIVALVHPPVSLFELTCLAEVFRNDSERPSGYKLAVSAMNSGPVATTGGMDVHVVHGLELLPLADTIIIPSWDIEVHPPCEIAAAIRAAEAAGTRLVGIGSGTFLLAALGLLSGRKVTTHWSLSSELALRYPKLCVQDNEIYVDEGSVLTGAGGTATLDLLLHIVRMDEGMRSGKQVADRLLLQNHRLGWQPQRVRRSLGKKGDKRIGAVLEHLRADPAKPHSKEELAAIAAMSVRTFYRRFTAEVGITPADWLVQERLTIARELLEESTLSIDLIGAEAGFGSTQSFRVQFHKLFGKTPAAYRREHRLTRAGLGRKQGPAQGHRGKEAQISYFGGRAVSR